MSVYKFNDKFEYLENKDKVILANNKDGKWIKITKECFEIIDDMIIKRQDIEKELEAFDDEDKNYLADLLKTLNYMGIMSEENE
ncbi:MAG: hypothetical protein ACRC6T_08295 [Sarcina sp.]